MQLILNQFPHPYIVRSPLPHEGVHLVSMLGKFYCRPKDFCHSCFLGSLVNASFKKLHTHDTVSHLPDCCADCKHECRLGHFFPEGNVQMHILLNFFIFRTPTSKIQTERAQFINYMNGLWGEYYCLHLTLEEVNFRDTMQLNLMGRQQQGLVPASGASAFSQIPVLFLAHYVSTLYS